MKKILAVLIALSLALSLAACKPQEAPSVAPQETVSGAELVAQLQDKYASAKQYEYQAPRYNLARDERFDFELGFSPVELGFEDTSEIIGFYTDDSFTQMVSTAFELNESEGGYTFSLFPYKYPAMALRSTANYVGLEPEKLSDDPYLYYKGENGDWGNLPQYYMVQWVDLDTGEKLEKPLVTVFTVATELAAPQLQFSILDDGTGVFTWNAVPGATKYYIIEATSENTKYAPQCDIIGETTTTTWHSKHLSEYSLNSKFVTYVNSEDSAGEATDSYRADRALGVIAVNAGGTSAVSAMLDVKEFAKLLPHAPAFNSFGENEVSSYPAVIGLMPAQYPITMCDGSTALAPIIYDTASASISEETWYSYDGDTPTADNLTAETVRVLIVPYTVMGTPFTGRCIIENFDDATYEAELAKVVERQNKLAGRAGSTPQPEVTAEEAPEEKPEEQTAETAENMQLNTEDKVFATNALGEYLAVCMINRMEIIPLDGFPEATDMAYLADTWSEAVYQNPLILGASGAQYNSDYNLLLVTYDEDAETTAAKQEAIRAEVKRVAAEIIKDGMSDLEKETAINDYLCESAEYDFDALDNAATHDYMYVDPEFNDAFTPYGILVNKVGVCASYASSFKLLADAAGLDSIVVTGYLSGSLAHAWNRVNVDGEWATVDVTNNDNPMLYNALFNLPDSAAALALLEDDRFMMDDSISSYAASGDANEYYHIQDKYFDAGAIADELASSLKADGTAVLRTSYSLDDAQFQSIAQQVMTKLGVEQLYGYYWLGVICLSLESE